MGLVQVYQLSEISDAVEHLNQLRAKVLEEDRDADPWKALASNELAWVEEEILKCASDFRYAAFNYFWLGRTKKRKSTLFKLWTVQEYFLSIILSLWEQGLPAWVIVHKARQIGACLRPDTPVLTSDLRWIPITDIELGQEILACDEFSARGKGSARRMRVTTVEAKRWVNDYALRIILNTGKDLFATSEHRLLSRVRGGKDTVWKRCKDLRPGDVLRRFTDAWSSPTVPDAWVGGILDGEGSIRKKHHAGSEVCISQSEGLVLDRARDYLSGKGYHFREDVDRREPGESSKLGSKIVHKLVLGRLAEIFRLVGTCRPERFTHRIDWWEGKELPGNKDDEGWARIEGIEILPTQHMVDLQTGTGTYIADGIVSHNSSVCEALMAWKNIFFDHQISAIIAQDPNQAAHLFEITLHIIDHLPWWMRPMESSREFKEAMVLENPNNEERSYHSGLDNWIMANGCNKISSFMQGKPISNLHASEIPSWGDAKAREILQGDTKWGLVREPGCFAVLESKPKGMTGYWYNLWHVYEGQGVDAEYFPFYASCFFEKSRKEIPPADWQPNDEMVEIREEYAKDWRVCSDCGTPNRTALGVDFCLKCGSDKSEPIFLSDAQLYWYYLNEKAAKDLGEEEVRLFYQEMPVKPEQGFQHSGITVFPSDVLFRVQKSVKAGERGFFDDQYQWHAAKNCRVCKDDHFVGTEKNIVEEFPMQIWELPQPGAKYCVGIDVAEGQEEGDFSCASVLKIGYGAECPDTQVAEWHGHVDAIEFARICYVIGMAYNTAMLAIDAFGPGYGTQAIVIHQMNYPNYYRWKHLDSISRIQSNKAGVWPNYKTRRTMIAFAIRWLRRGFWQVRSFKFLEEMPFFVKDEEDAKAEALQGHFDDAIWGNIYSVYAWHENDTDPRTSRLDIPAGIRIKPLGKCWTVTCCRGHVFDADDPRVAECPVCKKEDPDRRTLVKMAEKKVNSVSTLAASLIAQAERPVPVRKTDLPFEYL